MTLSLGVAVTAATYQCTYAVLVRPLQYPNARRITVIWNSAEPSGRRIFASEDVPVVRSLAAVQAVCSYGDLEAEVRAGAATAPMQVAFVSPECLDVLGVHVIAGRALVAADAAIGAEPVALVTDERFAQVGERLRVDQADYRVVGILPGRAAFPDSRTAVLLPLALPARSGWAGSTIVLLASRMSPTVLAHDLKLAFERAHRTSVKPGVQPLQSFLAAPVAPTLIALQFSALLLLCLAVLNAMWTYGLMCRARRPELAVRVALGATPSRIVRMLYLEASAACLAIALVSWPGAVIVAALIDQRIPGGLRVYMEPSAGSPGASVLLCLAAAVAAMGLAAIPSWIATHRWATRAQADTVSPIKAATTAGLLLASLQFAVVCGTAASTLWCAAALYRVRSMNVGFGRPDFVYYRLERADPGVELLQTQWRDALTALNGRGVAAALTNVLPLSREDQLTSIRLPGGAGAYPKDYSMMRLRVVSGTFFEFVGLTCLRGRCATPRSIDTVVLNRVMARQLFGSEDVIGRHLQVAGSDWEVGGVVSSTRHGALSDPPAPEAYVDISSVGRLSRTAADWAARRMYLMTRPATGHSESVLSREFVGQLFPSAKAAEGHSFSDRIWRAAAPWAAVALAASVFAVVALLVLANAARALAHREITEHLKEIAIRVAVDGTVGQAISARLRTAVLYISCGTVLGILSGHLLIRMLRARLQFPIDAVRPSDLIWIFVSTATIVAAVAAASAAQAIVHARRTSIATLLRQE